MAKNRSLEKKLEQIPSRFAEIARENKVLVKETALMHYNLGVFYTKNKEYSRAIAEFEKDVELNPDDAAAHYNIGFIYAEYLTNRPLAITHFRKFLSLVKSEDKDVDWVKKYILTWQTWEGKKPIN
jgi:tetratricopeptide (TPR) repeat protein